MTRTRVKRGSRFLVALPMENGSRCAGLCFMIVLLLNGHVLGQGKDDIILKHADVFAGKNVNGEDIRE